MGTEGNMISAWAETSAKARKRREKMEREKPGWKEWDLYCHMHDLADQISSMRQADKGIIPGNHGVFESAADIKAFRKANERYQRGRFGPKNTESVSHPHSE
ncbi:uncharacterized protein NECHADRAFT_89473 [Fusarium vanettenii 77-13-4]|uniref:Uncharacterized protein n=1 Tax=Fusarium vanettenii (strain ATCC MYA-4622 / CBS 123669 / FGSC 9596 / NRRL 45880 / 77-13-4) TaxID=660122 RepID=C7ZRA5_FUSV7|nr:uncharacterized protein NECHADRAFT_89473 [Fusarium vanettenii 77-13-4]EEU33454.1 predicted protein [Fusarium vanettenii 77-13-4]